MQDSQCCSAVLLQHTPSRQQNVLALPTKHADVFAQHVQQSCTSHKPSSALSDCQGCCAKCTSLSLAPCTTNTAAAVTLVSTPSPGPLPAIVPPPAPQKAVELRTTRWGTCGGLYIMRRRICGAYGTFQPSMLCQGLGVWTTLDVVLCKSLVPVCMPA